MIGQKKYVKIIEKWCKYFRKTVSSELILIDLPFQQQFSRKFGLVDRRRMAGNQLPFHRPELRAPTNQLLCCNPVGVGRV